MFIALNTSIESVKSNTSSQVSRIDGDVSTLKSVNTGKSFMRNFSLKTCATFY